MFMRICNSLPVVGKNFDQVFIDEVSDSTRVNMSPLRGTRAGLSVSVPECKIKIRTH